MKIYLRSLLIVSLFLFSATSVRAQVSIGADLVSRYVWRGFDFGESFSIQPALTFGSSGFEIGAWASYSIAADGSGANEHDIWAGYTADLSDGASLSFGVTDYYFPFPGATEDGLDFFNYDGDGEGAHYIEPYASLTGPSSFPVTVYGAFFVHNDPDNSFYLEASVPIPADGVDLGLTAGAILGESAFYGTNTATIVNLGIAAGKEIKITDAFSLPVSVGFILNPTPGQERSFLVFGLSL